MIFPIVLVTKSLDKNGTNKPCLVLMNPNAEHFESVLAQEVYESQLRTHPVRMFLIFSKKFRREMELMGHEIETQHAVKHYGVDEHQKRVEEANALIFRYKDFRGETIDDVIKLLQANKQKALAWLEQYQRPRFVFGKSKLN